MSKKVLIVEDEAVILMLLEQTLESLADDGVQVLTARNGAEALSAIREERPDLVLLDAMMPVMNGFDVCRSVKCDPSLHGTFVTMVTAKGQEFDRAEGAAVGADRYLLKPFDPNEVLRHASEVLGVRR